MRGVFDRLRTVELRAGSGYFEGQNYLDGSRSEWATSLGYGSTNKQPALVVASDPSRTYGQGSIAAVDLHTRATDATVTPQAIWRVEGRQDGKYALRYYNGSGTWTTVMTLDNAGNLNFGVAGATVTAGGTVQGNFLLSTGDRVRLQNAKTPTSSADTYGGPGDIARDDNYIYVKTSTGWKRAALTTF